ncbi:hypothetical protein QFZ76_005693 [Streptomyces sp. V4I2]|nr:hypothetical protein [Streptomyces sp. V4I2]
MSCRRRSRQGFDLRFLCIAPSEWSCWHRLRWTAGGQACLMLRQECITAPALRRELQWPGEENGSRPGCGFATDLDIGAGWIVRSVVSRDRRSRDRGRQVYLDPSSRRLIAARASGVVRSATSSAAPPPVHPRGRARDCRRSSSAGSQIRPAPFGGQFEDPDVGLADADLTGDAAGVHPLAHTRPLDIRQLVVGHSVADDAHPPARTLGAARNPGRGPRSRRRGCGPCGHVSRVLHGSPARRGTARPTAALSPLARLHGRVRGPHPPAGASRVRVRPVPSRPGDSELPSASQVLSADSYQ